MRGNYIGKTCPYCQFPIKQDSEVVLCPGCKVPHHSECWNENGGCTTFGCRGTTYQSAAADRLEISLDESSGRQSAPVRGEGFNKLLVSTVVTTLLVLVVAVFAYFNLLNNRSAALSGDAADMPPQTYPPAVLATLDADYYIDYENGTMPIGDLPIGARVVDPSWEWEFHTGDNYNREAGDETKPVIWIVVAKDHYSGIYPHVTLLSEELIGNFWFDNSSDRGSVVINNNWGKSGTTNATCGLRPWLNSIGIHEGEGFYRAFSLHFKKAVIKTSIPNREWENGDYYSTEDYVFIPSTTELGDSEHSWTYQIGETYPYFIGSTDIERIARLGMEEDRWYWTRSPCSSEVYSVRSVAFGGSFFSFCPWETGVPDNRGIAVRPALNLKSDTLVSEIR